MNFLSQYKPLKKNKIDEFITPDNSALVRVDYNVPIKNDRVKDDRRIRASFETIDKLLKLKLNPILFAHLADPSESLRPVAKILSKKYKIVFISNDIFDPRTKEIIASVPSGTVVLFENLRRYPEEKSNDKNFAKLLASFGNIYVNDAFSVSHRAHSSIVSLPKLLPSFAGYQFELEFKTLSSILNIDKHPFVFILGGAKFSTKIPLVSQFSSRVDKIIIGGAILNNFYKVAGFEIGKSVTEEGYDKEIKKILSNPKFLLPTDVVVEVEGKKHVSTIDEIKPSDMIVDIGPASVNMISQALKNAKVIIWNGPMGWYEKGYVKGTVALAKTILESQARAVIGGGDTGATIDKMISKYPNKKVFVSTAGGAAIDFLSHGTIVGIQALK